MTEDNTLRKLQLLELDMLKEVLAVCGRHGIPYYALGGTLLGAVRHRGFIPWDDDIDIGIPRPDYERFLSFAEKELPAHLHPVWFERQSGDERPVYACQVRDDRYEVIQHIANEPIRTNLWIDIFPLDGMPDGKIARKIHSFRLLYRRARIQFSMFDRNVHQHRTNRPWYERAAIRFFRATGFGSRSSPFKMMEKMDRALKKYPYGQCGWLVNFMGAWKLKEMFRKSVYGDGADYPFEDLAIRGPADADAVLTQMYGNYMEPVRDPEEQKKHHGMEIRDL